MSHSTRRRAVTLTVSAALIASPRRRSAPRRRRVKVGIVGPFSGPFAHYGTLFKNGAEAYIASQGGKLAGKEVELIYRDTGGPNPGQTKTLVQELIVKDKVDYLGGFVFTPNAFAVAPLIQQIADADGDLQRRHLGDHRQERVLHPHQLHAVAGDGADGAVGGEEQHQEGRHRGHRLRPGHRRRDRVEERVHQAGRHRGRDRSACRSRPPTSRPSCSASRPAARRRSTPSCPAARRTSAS